MALRQLLRARGSGVRIGRNASLFLWTVFLSNVGVSGIFLLLYNLYLVALGYQEDFIGLLSLVQMGAIAVGAIPTGALADRVGPRPVLIVGTLVIAVGALGMSLVASPVALALLNVVTGIGFAMRVVPYTPFLAVNTSPAQRTLVFSANSAAISIAGTTGSLIGGQLPALFSTVFGLGGADSIMAFRISLAFGALVGLLAAIPISRTTDKSEGPPPEVATGGTAPPLDRSPAESRRLTTLLVGATLLFAFSGALVGPFVNVYFSRVLGLSASSISFILAASSLLAAVATVAASRLADRIGTVRTMVLVRAAGAPMLILLALNPGAWLGVLAVLLRNVTDMAGWPLDGAFLAEVVHPRRQARTVAYRSVAWNATWGIASLGAGQAIVRVGYGPLFAVAGSALLAAVLFYHLAFRHYNRPRGTAEQRDHNTQLG
ncbi:MAG: MFS transporter [Anaerolineae bacterium]|nr:MFS transporter [Anaerolineae bacterium]